MRNVSIDMSELERFVNNFNNAYEMESAMRSIAKLIAQVLHQHLIEQTPVDTGNLRKMWSAGENLLFTVNKVDGGYEVVFVNSAINKSKKYPNGFMYGLAVNDGHRTPTGGWVMGRFFVENAITLTKESGVIEKVIMTELQKWWDAL